MSNRVLLTGHSSLPQGVRDAALLILGDREDLLATSPYTGDLDALLTEAESVRSVDPDGLLLIITDIAGGSPHNAVLQLTRFPNVRVLSGMSLPLVVGLLTQLDGLKATSTFDAVLEEARGGLAEHRLPTRAAPDDEEDFA